MPDNSVELRHDAITGEPDNPVVEYGDSLMHVIAKAARDPNVDIDKMERLLQMQERVENRRAEVAFNEAMRDCQRDMPQIVKDASNETTRSRYTRLETLTSAMTPVIVSHGFSMSFGTAKSDLDDHYRVTCRLSHDAGFSKDYHVDIPIDNTGMKGSKNKTDTHGAGSAMSYGRRYLKLLIFDIATTDDDGNAAGNPLISVPQFNALKRKISDVGADESRFCEWLGVSDIESLQASRFKAAMNALSQKGGK